MTVYSQAHQIAKNEKSRLTGKYVSKMRTCVFYGKPAQEIAIDDLCELLIKLGYEDVVDEYRKIT